MKKMIVKRKVKDQEDLMYWIKDTLTFAMSEFGKDNCIVSGYITDDDYYIVTVVEKVV